MWHSVERTKESKHTRPMEIFFGVQTTRNPRAETSKTNDPNPRRIFKVCSFLLGVFRVELDQVLHINDNFVHFNPYANGDNSNFEKARIR